MKKIFYFITFFCIICTTFAQAQRNVIILDGGAVTQHFGTITVAQVPAENSPNSTTAGAVQLVGGAWSNGGFSDNAAVLKAQDIDLVKGTFTLDYKTSDVTGIYVLNLNAWDGTGVSDILKGANNYVLTADGTWHTLTLRFNTSWEAAIGTKIATSANIAPPRVVFQFGATGGTLLLDNIVYNAPGGATNINSINTNAFDVYPNPVTNGRLNIKTNDNIQSVEIYTLTGLLLTTNYSINGNLAEIPLSKVSSGSYIVRLKTNNEILSRRFIVK